jgi:hypothetical protein
MSGVRLDGGATDLVHRLEHTRDETLRLFALGDDDLARTYAPGKWPVRPTTSTSSIKSERRSRVLHEDGWAVSR